MTMSNARWVIIGIGLCLPYAVRVPWGWEWLNQYFEMGWGGWLFFTALNVASWIGLLLLSVFFRYPRSLVPAALLGFGALAFMHASLDLSADAQAAVALIFIPFIAAIAIVLGGVMGIFLEWQSRKNAREKTHNDTAIEASH